MVFVLRVVFAQKQVKEGPDMVLNMVILTTAGTKITGHFGLILM